MRLPWRTALGVALSAGGLYWALHRVQWGDFAHDVRASDALLWVGAVIASQLIFPMRAARWRPILHSVAPNVRFGALWRSTAIGMMVNNVVIPARLGELARAYVLTKEDANVPFAGSLASLAVDRGFDGFIVFALILVALLDPRFSSDIAVSNGKSLGTAIGILGVGVAVGFAALYTAVFAPQWFENTASALSRRFIPTYEVRVRMLARHFAAGLGVLRDPRRFVIVVLWSVAHWLMNALAMWLGFKALGIDVPPTAALLAQGLIVIGAAAPQLPGYFGTFEAAAAIALGAYSVSQTQAIAWALTYHILTLVPITLAGMWYLGKVGLSLGELRGRAQAPTAT